MTKRTWIVYCVVAAAVLLGLAGAASAQFSITKSVPDPPPANHSFAIASMKASLRYGIGEIVPVKGEEFVLLNQDPAAILSHAGLHGDGPLDEVHTYAAYRIFPDADHAAFEKAARAALDPHIIARATTDQAGQAQFPQVPAGSYFILGVVKTRDGMAIWNQLVKMTGGPTAITLDYKNVELAN
jgi:hypothetical protein